jgi:hypothetical protein
MLRTVFAMAVAALVVVAVSGTSQAAAIAPLAGAAAAATAGNVTQVRYCWRGRWGHLHCRR